MGNLKIDLDEVLQKCCGNHELVERIASQFSDSLPATVDSLLNAVCAENRLEVEKIAHRLKGESGTMCAYEVNSLASQLCDASKNESYERLDELSEALKEESDLCCASIRNHFSLIPT